MKTLCNILLIFTISDAYLPKNELFNILIGEWKYDSYGGGIGGLPLTPINYNSKIGFIDLAAADSIHYWIYYNDSLMDSSITPLFLVKSSSYPDTQWAIKIRVAISETTTQSLGTTCIGVITDTFMTIGQCLLIDGYGFGFKRSTISNESFSSIAKRTLNVFPNPFNSSTQITLPNTKANAKIRIYTISGKLIDSFQIKATHAWHPGTLPNGVYILKANIGEKTYSKKLLLNR